MHSYSFSLRREFQIEPLLTNREIVVTLTAQINCKVLNDKTP